MTPPRTSRIPVIVLAGFLGSGKTTLLNHLLRNRAGNRIGVIVNDFGSIEIDAMTVAGQVGSPVSLGNGCLCCAVDASELDTCLETLTRPAARLDVIIIEASGLAEPQELVRMPPGCSSTLRTGRTTTPWRGSSPSRISSRRRITAICMPRTRVSPSPPTYPWTLAA